MDRNSKLHDELMEVRHKLWTCEKSLSDSNIVNPLDYQNFMRKHQLAVDGLKAIRVMKANIGAESIIAGEVLLQIEAME